MPIDCFYKHSRMADGYLNFCKECVKTRVNTRYDSCREKISVYEKARNQQSARKLDQQATLANYRLKYPEKYAARYAVGNAIRSGRITKPKTCSRCGSDKLIQAHHHDYQKPLDVIWLCFACHREDEHGQVVVSVGW